MPLSLRKTILRLLTESSGVFPEQNVDLEEAALCWEAEVHSTQTLIWIRVFDFFLTSYFLILGPHWGIKLLRATPLDAPWRSWMSSLIGMSLK